VVNMRGRFEDAYDDSMDEEPPECDCGYQLTADDFNEFTEEYECPECGEEEGIEKESDEVHD